jgi:hypothetical protein
VNKNGTLGTTQTKLPHIKIDKNIGTKTSNKEIK